MSCMCVYKEANVYALINMSLCVCVCVCTCMHVCVCLSTCACAHPCVIFSSLFVGGCFFFHHGSLKLMQVKETCDRSSWSCCLAARSSSFNVFMLCSSSCACWPADSDLLYMLRKYSASFDSWLIFSAFCCFKVSSSFIAPSNCICTGDKTTVLFLLSIHFIYKQDIFTQSMWVVTLYLLCMYCVFFSLWSVLLIICFGGKVSLNLFTWPLNWNQLNVWQWKTGRNSGEMTHMEGLSCEHVNIKKKIYKKIVDLWLLQEECFCRNTTFTFTFSHTSTTL